MDQRYLADELAETFRRGECDTLLIAGPTASGKSALALALAERLGGRIINADSMQVYADLRVLSARPDPADEARAPHLLYGFVGAEREYSVGAYLRDIADLLGINGAEKRPAIVVGGTGLYFRALTEGLVETPSVPLEIRSRWEAAARAGVDLHAALAQRDPEAAARLHPADFPRLLRALEVFEASGKPISAWWASKAGAPLLTPGRWRGVFLEPSREALFQRIDSRFMAMIAAGALEEVRRIACLGLPANRGVMKAHGLPHLAAHLAGGMSLDEAIMLGQRDTRRYAKRQLTWARKFMTDWRWVQLSAAP